MKKEVNLPRENPLEIQNILPRLGIELKQVRPRKNSPLLGVCPFCSFIPGVEPPKRLTVSVINQTFKCQSCKESGDTIQFVSWLKKCEKQDAVYLIAKISA